MSPTGWLALAAGTVLFPGAAGPSVRANELVGAGRLRAGPARRLRVPVPVPAGGLVAAALAGGVALLAATAGPLLGLAAAGIVAVGWPVVRSGWAARQAGAARVDLARALGVLIAELEAGGRPADALDSAAAAGARHRPVFLAAAAEAAVGGDAAGVLAAEPATAGLACAWRLGEQTGAPLTGVLSRVAADLAQVTAQQRAVAIALAGPRSSAVVLTGLPLVGVALGTAMGAHPVPFLLSSRAGPAVCCAGVLLDAAGVLWMQRILRRAARTR